MTRSSVIAIFVGLALLTTILAYGIASGDGVAEFIVRVMSGFLHFPENEIL